MNTKELNTISIKQYLSHSGIEPKTDRGFYGMYLSPFRQETSPSFKVDYQKNLWYDFGLNEGGTMIDLVMKLNQCSFLEAVEKLQNINFNPESFSFHPNHVIEKEQGLKIVKILPLQNLALVNYLKERNLNIDIAKQYCREVYFQSNGKSYFAVGFRNNSGGYELRNKYFQGCTSKDITLYENQQNECFVFEGFTDFLSFLTLENKAQLENNIIVLNSVVNLSRVADFLKKQNTIHTFLDNDEAGKRTLSEIQKLGKLVIDHSALYRNFKDLNEYLCIQKQSLNLPIKKGNSGLKHKM